MTELRPSRILIALTLVGLSSTSALAVDANAFAERLKAAAEDQGTPIEYGEVATEGETVILNDLRIGTGEEGVDLGDVRFENVTGSTEEGWRVERVPFADVDTTQEETRTTATGMQVEGLTIAPPAEGAEEQLTALQFERAGFESVVVEQGSEEVARFTGLSVTNQPGETGGFEADFALEEFVVDATPPETPEAGAEGSAVMAELGYEQLRGDISGKALWETSSGELSLSPLRIAVEEAGILNFAYTISGYTPAFVQQLAALQQQMAENPEGEGSGMAMLGLISQLYVNSAELSFEDQSLTNRLLDYYAEENGQSRDDLIQSLLGSLPLALGYLNNPEFQAEVTQAVEEFLRDPQSITLAIAPDEPVPATQIVGAAMGAPQTLPAVLQLSVTSNE